MGGHSVLQTMRFCGRGKVFLCSVVGEASLGSIKVVNVYRTADPKQCAQPLQVLLPFFEGNDEDCGVSVIKHLSGTIMSLVKQWEGCGAE